MILIAGDYFEFHISSNVFVFCFLNWGKVIQVISKMAESFRKNNSNETELFQNIENFEHSVKLCDCVDVQV